VNIITQEHLEALRLAEDAAWAEKQLVEATLTPLKEAWLAAYEAHNAAKVRFAVQDAIRAEFREEMNRQEGAK
jgi:hypothetical protein